MAESGKILEKDLIEKSVYEIGKKIAESLEPASKEIEELKDTWKSSLDEMKKAALAFNGLQGDFKGAANMSEFIQAKERQKRATENATRAIEIEHKTISSLVIAQKEQDRMAKQLVTTIERKKLATKNITEALAKERYELQELNKRAKESAILSSSLATEYEKQVVRLSQLRVKYKDVALTLGENSGQAKRLQAEIAKLDATLKRVDGNVGQFQRNVGNYGKVMESASMAARNMMSAMGFVGGAYLFVNVMRDAFDRVRQFDKSMQDLTGVLRVSRASLKPLEDDIIDVSAGLAQTAKDVADLAVELAQLGKNEKQISRLLAPTVKLGVGLRTTSDEAGAFLVQMLNVFGESEDRAEEYADTLAGISISTTLDFEKMRDGFQYLAPISKILNKDLAYTGAILGILTDNGLKAENAARVLATSQQRLSKMGMNLNDALLQLIDAKKRNIDETDLLKLAYKLMGAEGAKTAVILADNYEAIEKNSEAMRNQQGVLDDLVKEQLNSLDSKLKQLDAAWEKLILTVESGEGSFAQFFKTLTDGGIVILDFLTTLEKAEDTLFRITGATRRNTDGFLGIKALFGSDYNELRDYAKEMNQTLEGLGGLRYDNLVRELQNVSNEIKGNSDLSLEEIKLRKFKIDAITGEINQRRKSRSELLREAEALGANNKLLELGKNEMDGYVDRMLNDFITSKKKTTDTTEESTEKTKEDNKAQRAAAKAAKDRARAEEELRRALEARLKLMRESEFKSNISDIDVQTDDLKRIIDDEKRSYQERLLAATQYYQLKENRAAFHYLKEIEDLNESIESKKAADLKLVSSEAEKNKIIEQYAQIHKDQLNVIEDTYQNNLEANTEESNKTKLKLLEDYFNSELKIIKDAEAKKNAEQNKEIGEAQITLSNSNRTTEDVERYEKAVAEIKKKYALEAIRVQIADIEELMRDEKLTNEERQTLAKQLHDLKIAYSNEETDQIIENIKKTAEEERKAAEEWESFRRDTLSMMSEGLGEALNVNSSLIFDFFNNLEGMAENIATNVGVTWEDVLQTMSAAAAMTRGILASVYQANIEDLERQLDAVTEYYDRQYELAEGDQIQQDLIREEQQKKEDELKKKIKKEKTEAAKADKAAALIQAGINTALAVTSALTFAPPVSFVMAALSLAMGLAQIAVIASKPIPKYKHGKRNHEGGLAILGDGGVSEVVRTPDGKLHKTPAKDTLYDLPKGTDVFKSEDEYRKIMRASILTSLEIDNARAKDFNAERSFEKNYQKLNGKEIEEAISNGFKKQKVHFHTSATAKVDLNYSLWKMKQLSRE